ncbi:hypothetical protein [Acidovorax sp. Leaf160]|uniref:hypothetical protein n=1 Tax=Acidovorax sp. Leaf160 TaxID=1736280 RepID=UPI000AD92EFA|nr:hypothetical protein [Acidovorax sp. Leaf160]
MLQTQTISVGPSQVANMFGPSVLSWANRVKKPAEAIARSNEKARMRRAGVV